MKVSLPFLLRRVVASITALSFALQPILAPIAAAQQITDPRAPIQFRPSTAVSGNGTPVVNITTPSFGGISHNKFERYNVDTRGVILNNSGYNGTSVIGGAVTANPNLVGRPTARVILNEVTGTTASTLNGPTEVFGSRADVIIANPNGVGCIGCTFINAGRITLSTGVPNPDYTLGTVRYSVTGGTVSVSGSGLKGGAGENLGNIDLIGRQIRVEGPLEARGAVRLRAGAIDYDQGIDSVTALAGAAGVAGPAISSSVAGTIKAGTLSVLSQDVDLGVALDGGLTALAGEVSIRSRGAASVGAASATTDIAIEGDGAVYLSGRKEAIGRLSLRARSVVLDVSSSIAANSTIVMEALEGLVARGTLQSGQDISLTSGGSLIASGTITALGRVVLEGNSIFTANLGVSGSHLTLAGLTTLTLNNTGLRAQSDIALLGDDLALGSGTAFDAGGTLRIIARNSLNNQTILDYPHLDLVVRNQLIVSATGAIVQDILLLNVRDSIDNQGTLYGTTSATLNTGTLSNSATGVIYGGDVAVNLSGTLTNLGRVLSSRTLNIVTTGLVQNNSLLHAQGNLTLKAATYQANSVDAVLAGANSLIITSGAFENLGRVLGTNSLTLRAASLANAGTLASGGFASLTTSGDIRNTGSIGAQGDLTIGAGGAIVSPGHIVSQAGALSITATGAVKSGGDLIAAGRVYLRAASFESTAVTSRLAGNAIDAGVTGEFTNLGLVSSSGWLRLDVGRLNNGPSLANALQGTILGHDLNLTSTGDIINQGILQAANAFAFSAGGDLTNSGAILALVRGTTPNPAYFYAGSLVAGGNVVNSGRIQVDDTLVFRAGGTVTQTSGAAIGARVMDFRAAGALDNAGTILATGQLTLASADLTNRGANAVIAAALGSLTINGHLVNDGYISALGGLALAVTGHVTSPGHISVSQGALTLNAGGLVASGGDLLASGSLNVTANGYQSLSTASRLGGTDVTLRLGSGDFLNLGRVGASGNLLLDARAITNAATGTIGAGALRATASGEIGNAGAIQSAGNLALTGAGAFSNSGTLIGGGNAAISLAGGFNNAGSIDLVGSLTLNAASYQANLTTSRLAAASIDASITGNVTNAGLFTASGPITLRAANLANAGANAALTGSDIRLSLTGGLTNDGLIGATHNLVITASTDVISSGHLIAQTGSLNLATSGALSSGGYIAAQGAVTLRAASYTSLNANSRIGGATLDLAFTGDVSNLGIISANTTLTLGAAGSLANSGQIASNGDATLTISGALTNNGAISAAKALQVHAASYLSIASTAVLAADTINLSLPGAFENAGRVIGKTALGLAADSIRNSGASSALLGESVSLNATTTLTNDGVIGAASGLAILAGGNVISVGHLIAQNGALTLSAGGSVTSGGDIVAGGALALTATDYTSTSNATRLVGNSVSVNLGRGAFTNLGTVQSLRDFTLNAGSLTNGPLVSGTDAGRITAANLAITLSGGAANDGAMLASNSYRITTGAALTNKGLLAGNGEGTLSVGGLLTNNGTIAFNNLLTLTAGSYAGSAGSQIASDTLAMTVSGALSNAGALMATANLMIDAGSLTNSGATSQIVGGTSRVTAQGVLNNDGTIASEHALTLNVTGALANAGHLTASHGDLLLAAGGTVTSSGDIAASGRVTLNASGYTATSTAARLAGQDVSVSLGSGRFANQGLVASANTLGLTTGAFSNSGTLHANSTTIHLSGAATNSGTIVSLGALDFRSSNGGLSNTSNALVQSGTDLTLNFTGQMTNNGSLLGANTLSLTASSYLGSDANARLETAALTATTSGAFSTAGRVIGQNSLALNAASLALYGTNQVLGGNSVGLTISGNVYNEGLVLGTNGLTLNAGGGLDNRGVMQSDHGALSLTIAGDATLAGSFVAATNLTLNAASLSSTNANTQIAGTTVTLALQRDLANQGLITSTNALAINARNLTNTGAGSTIVGAGAAITLTGSATNQGAIQSTSALTAAGTLNNSWVIASETNATLSLGGALNNSGSILANDTLRVSAASLDNQTGGKLKAYDTTLVLAGSLVNSGKITAVNRLTSTSGALTNNTTGLMSAYVTDLTTNGNLANSGTLSATAGLSARVHGALVNSGALTSQGDMALTLDGALTHQAGGQILATGTSAISATSLTNALNARLEANQLGITLTGALANNGTILASDLAAITASAITNQGTSGNHAIISADRLSVTTTGLLNNAGYSTLQGASTAQVSAGSVNAGFLTNTGVATGRFNFSRNLDFTLTGSGYTFDSQLMVAGNLRFAAHGNIINNTLVAAGGTLALVTDNGSISNNAGATLYSVGDMALSARGDVTNTSALIQSFGNMTILAGGKFLNTRGPSILTWETMDEAWAADAAGTPRRFYVHGSRLWQNLVVYQKDSSIAGVVDAQGSLTVQLDAFNNDASTISVAGDLTVSANTFSNAERIFRAGGHLWKLTGDKTGYRGFTSPCCGNGALPNYIPGTSSSPAVITVGGNFSSRGAVSFTNTGAITANTATIQAPTVTIGITDPNVWTPVARTPRSTIDLSNYVSVLQGNPLYRTASLSLTEVPVSEPGLKPTPTNPIKDPVLVRPQIGTSTVDISFNPPATLPSVGTLNVDAGKSVSGPQVLPPAPQERTTTLDRTTLPRNPVNPNLTLNVAVNPQTPRTPGSTSVNVTYLYRAPLSGSTSRDPTWILSQVGDARSNLTFFADPTAERRVIQQALLDQTGRTLIDPSYRNPNTQQERLYQGTVEFLKTHPELHLGDTLTKEQRASITAPTLWYETRTIDNRQVLVPELILPPGDFDRYRSGTGGTITADNISIIGDAVHNTGILTARQELTVVAGDFLNEQRLVPYSAGTGHGHILEQGGILSGKNVTITALRSLTAVGGRISGSGDVSLTAAGNVNIVPQIVDSLSILKKGKVTTTTSTLRNIAAEIKAGDTLTITSTAGDILLKASQLTGQTVLLSSGGKLYLEAVQNTQSLTENKGKNYSKQAQSLTIGTEINATGDITLLTAQDFSATAAQVNAGRALDLIAKGSISITAGEDEVMSESMQIHKKNGFFSSKTTTVYNYSDEKTAVGSSFTGNTVSVSADGNLTVIGSSISANGNVTLDAGGRIDLLSARDYSKKEHVTTVKTSGLMGAMGGGVGFSIGTRKVSDTNQNTSISNVASVVGSLLGNVTIRAGGDFEAKASMVEALVGDVTLQARRIAFEAGIDTATSYSAHSDKFSGLSLSIGASAGSPLAQAQAAINYLSAASKTRNDKAQLLYSVAAAIQGAQGARGIASALGSSGDLASLASVSMKIGLGSMSSKSEAWSTSQQASGGQAIAGGSLTMTATGGDLTLTGARIQGKDIGLRAAQDLILRSLALVNTSESKSSSRSVFAGLSLSISPSNPVTFGLYADASGSNSRSQTSETQHAQTLVSGTGKVTLESGRDAQLLGAEVLGKAIKASIGRNLTIVSDQDTAAARATQSAWNVSASLGLGVGSSPIQASLSGGMSQGKASGAYRSVTAPAGLFAGKDGFDITVGAVTSLTAAALASDAEASRNKLETAALITKSLENASNWKAKSWGFSASLSTSPSGSGFQPSLPQRADGASGGTAQTTIAPGTIKITDPKLQKALSGIDPATVVASLNRSSTAQNEAATKLPGLSEILADQSALAQAFSAASAAAAKAVGDIAAAMRDSAGDVIKALEEKANAGEALSAAEQAQLADAREKYALWDEGGAGRTALHALTQGVLGAIGGGGAAGLEGALGAAVSGALGPALAEKLKESLLASGMENVSAAWISNLVTQLAVTGLGSAFGGTGAATSASVFINNYLTHKQVQDLLDELKACQGDKNCDESDKKEILRKYFNLSVNQDRELQSCTTYDCIAQHISLAATEKDTLAADMRALQEAGCPGCAAMLSAHNTEATLRSAYIAGWCVESPGPSCARNAKLALAGQKLAGTAVELALLEVGGRVIAHLANSLSQNLASVFETVFKRQPTAAELAAIESAAVAERLPMVRINATAGKEFEEAALAAQGVAKYSGQPIRVELTDGRVVTVIPDALNSACVMECKNVVNLSLSSQLEGEIELANQTKRTFTLIISPRTETMSKNLVEVIEKIEGKIIRFDPVTRISHEIKMPKDSNVVPK